MVRSVPQLVSAAAVAIGIVLFGLTLYYIDLEETVASARQLGLALPIILLPGTCWHVLRTWGWAVAFPEESRPPFTRLFRVRLAADAIGNFTLRGIAGEPLKVLLLYELRRAGDRDGGGGARTPRLCRRRDCRRHVDIVCRCHSLVDARRVGHGVHHAHHWRCHRARPRVAHRQTSTGPLPGTAGDGDRSCHWTATRSITGRPVHPRRRGRAAAVGSRQPDAGSSP